MGLKNLLAIFLLFTSLSSYGQVAYWFRYTNNFYKADFELQARALENDRAQYTFRIWKFVPLAKGLEVVVSPAYFHHYRPVKSRNETRFATGLRQHYRIAGLQLRNRILGEGRHFINERTEWRLRIQQSVIISINENYKIRPQLEWLVTNKFPNEIRAEVSAFSKIMKKYELGLGYQEQIINKQAHHCLLVQLR